MLMPASEVVRGESTDAADPEVRAVTAGGVHAVYEARAGPLEKRPSAVILRDQAEVMVWAPWGWVPYHCFASTSATALTRCGGRGLGAELSHAAAINARARACAGIRLDTLGFQAPVYGRPGFTRFGTLDGYPPGHSRM